MSKNRKAWSRNQRKFMLWLASDKYTRTPPTQQVLAKEIGVNESTLSRWKRLDGFWDEVNSIARDLFGEQLAQIYATIAREAIKGSYQHAKLALELVGELPPTPDATATVRLVIERENPSTVPAHLSRQPANGHQPAETVQRVGMWPALGKDDNGAGLSH